MTARLARSRVATLLLGALLFAQAAIALAGCDMQDRAPAQALAQRESMPCHEDPAPNPNLCLAHCTSADQSADTPQFVMPVWRAVAPLTVAVANSWRARVSAVRHQPPHAVGPPPRILFQSFLI
jgi:hypothetical protein